MVILCRSRGLMSYPTVALEDDRDGQEVARCMGGVVLVISYKGLEAECE